MIASNACLPRVTAARMASADLVQTNGLGAPLASALKRLMAVCNSTIEVKTPRLSRCRVSLANQPSTALAQEPGSRGEVEAEARMAGEPDRAGAPVVPSGDDFSGCSWPDEGLANWRAVRDAVYRPATLTVGTRLAVSDAQDGVHPYRPPRRDGVLALPSRMPHDCLRSKPERAIARS